MTLRYRADIDGLRAIAILPVILYHAGVPGFGGGFVGVDIIFVISDYLISQTLLADMQTGISLAAFYERRVRRILPALFLMLVVVLAVGAGLLLPRAYTETGQAALAATIFLANFEFWRQDGYFAEAALCTGQQQCRVVSPNGVPLFCDAGPFTQPGAAVVMHDAIAPRLAAILDNIERARHNP